MEEQTRKLLEECTKGCKMAINSMDQIRDYVKNEELGNIISDYKKKHKELEEETAVLLKRDGEEEKEPGMMASAFSWLTANMKLMIKEDSNQIAKLLMDGCNMGVQGITEALHKYKNASMESKSLAKKLVKTEEDFSRKLKAYL